MCEKFGARVSGWMLNLAKVQTTGCTLHQWEHPFQQSVPHMALRPLLHALSRHRVSFMLQDSGSLQASWPSDQLFWSSLASWQRGDFLHRDIWRISRDGLALEACEEFTPPSRWSFALDLTLEICAWTMLANTRGVYLLSSLEPWKKSAWILVFVITIIAETPFETSHSSSQAPCKALFSRGAQEERRTLGWTFCCLPKCLSSPTHFFLLPP